MIWKCCAAPRVGLLLSVHPDCTTFISSDKVNKDKLWQKGTRINIRKNMKYGGLSYYIYGVEGSEIICIRESAIEALCLYVSVANLIVICVKSFTVYLLWKQIY